MPLAVSCVRADVRLGDVNFDNASAELSREWFEPMTIGSSKALTGYGANAGHTRTISYSVGGDVVGVKTLKRTVVEKAATTTTENVWIAFDSQDNARVLKMERAGAVIFLATAAAVPPLYLPATPQEGQSWKLAGATVTIEQVIRSTSGYGLKVTNTATSGTTETSFLRAGDGLVQITTGEDSGWRLPISGPRE